MSSPLPKIPLARPLVGEEEISLVSEVIKSGWLTQGPKVQEFEQSFEKLLGRPFAVAVSSCTTALHLVLDYIGINANDEVIVPSLTYIATANVVRYCGATPIFVEVDPKTYNLQPKDVASKISKKTKAIMVVHQLGVPAELDELKKIADHHQIPLIEDAACAIGSRYQGQLIGSTRHSDFICFSFHPRKVVTTGDGGMIVCGKEKDAAQLKTLRQHGMSVSDLARNQSKSVVIDEYPRLGFNYRMTDLQAAVGIQQLKRLQEIVLRRIEKAKRYDQELANIPFLQLPSIPQGCSSNYQTYMIVLKDDFPLSRNDFMQMMIDRGIEVRRGLMTIHREICYENKYGKQHLPLSEWISDRSVNLPLYPQMTDEDQGRVIQAIKEISAKAK